MPFSRQLPMSKNIAPLPDLPFSSKFGYTDRSICILNLGNWGDNVHDYSCFCEFIFQENSLCESKEADAWVRINLLVCLFFG